MRFPLFFARYVVGAYLVVTVFLYVVALTDYIIGYYRGSYNDRHRLGFVERMFTVPTWPVLLFTVKGRKQLSRLWKNIIL